MKILWIIVNCNNVKEADQIGKTILQQRLAACFEIIPRLLTRYFWPPKSGTIEKAKGCILILETLPFCKKNIEKYVKKLHSDRVPFIGTITIQNVRPEYAIWLKGELRKPHLGARKKNK